MKRKKKNPSQVVIILLPSILLPFFSVLWCRDRKRKKRNDFFLYVQCLSETKTRLRQFSQRCSKNIYVCTMLTLCSWGFFSTLLYKTLLEKEKKLLVKLYKEIVFMKRFNCHFGSSTKKRKISYIERIVYIIALNKLRIGRRMM